MRWFNSSVLPRITLLLFVIGWFLGPIDVSWLIEGGLTTIIVALYASLLLCLWALYIQIKFSWPQILETFLFFLKISTPGEIDWGSSNWTSVTVGAKVKLFILKLIRLSWGWIKAFFKQ